MIIIITIKQWPRIRITHPKIKITKTIKTESKSPEDKSTPLSKESTNVSSETEEDQSAMIPTLNATEPSKKESLPTKPRTRDDIIYLNHNNTHYYNKSYHSHRLVSNRRAFEDQKLVVFL